MKGRGQGSIFFLLALLSLIGAWITDVLLSPRIIVASLYFIPILIIASYFRTRMIILFTLITMVVFSLQATAEAHHIVTIIIDDAAFMAVGLLTIQLNRQKLKIQQLKEDVEESKAQLEVFMNMVAHDLMQPVTAAKLYAETLAGMSAKNIEKDVSKRLLGSLENMKRMVIDLRDAAKIGIGRFEISPGYANISALINEVISEQQIPALKHKIIPHVQEKITGNFDEEGLRRVFTNLLSNAIKYSPRGEKIIITAKKSGGVLRASVADGGIGMTKSERELLFRPFTRVYNGKRKIEGTGLGLYIAKTIIEAHNGKIWVTGRKNHGSTFFVELPL